MTMRSEAYDDAIKSAEKKTSIKKIAMLTVGVGAVVASAVAGAIFGLDPHVATVGQFLATEGSLAVPAIFGGLASAAMLANGIQAKMSDKSAAAWAAEEKAETANMTPDQLEARKEKVGEKILLARDKAQKSEETMDKAVAVGTFISLNM